MTSSTAKQAAEPVYTTFSHRTALIMCAETGEKLVMHDRQGRAAGDRRHRCIQLLKIHLAALERSRGWRVLVLGLNYFTGP